jgi:hypothetical protein
LPAIASQPFSMISDSSFCRAVEPVGILGGHAHFPGWSSSDADQ